MKKKASLFKAIGLMSLALFLFVMFSPGFTSAATVDFEDLQLDSESYWNGADESGKFTSCEASFNNNYDAQWGSWNGFSYSNITDTETSGMDGQYNAIAGSGQVSSNYAVAYYSAWAESSPTITFPAPQVVSGAYFTNNNYAYYSMLEGDQFAKKFGGDDGTDPDWFLLTITGRDADGNETGTVEFYLADFRPDDNSQDYIVDNWRWVDLTSLGTVKSLEFSLTSSDTGDWGMNTPAYFCIDNVNGSPADQDADSDGIPDTQEVADTVDLNADGTPDNSQNNMASVKAAAGSGQIGVAFAPGGTVNKISAIKSIDPATIEDTAGRPENMPFGLIDFVLRGNAPGYTATVTVHLSEDVPDSAKWYKYDQASGWKDYSSHATLLNSRTIRLDLKDGGYGDADGIANGIIRDPGGVGYASSGGGVSSGCFIETLWNTPVFGD
ncbi:MAG: DUF4465 domain-containing protein [Deltaproteobacteria bacterium]|nr:DUF4465 domain-containing protein [Deltaproteobacteria bacterium]